MLQRKRPQFAKEITRKCSDLISVNLVICCVSRNKQRIFFTLIVFLIPLVIHGLENCFSSRLENTFKGALLFTRLFNVL